MASQVLIADTFSLLCYRCSHILPGIVQVFMIHVYILILEGLLYKAMPKIKDRVYYRKNSEKAKTKSLCKKSHA